MPDPNPRAEYTRRHLAHESGLARFQRIESQISNLRLGVFLVGVLVMGLAFRSDVLSWIYVAPPLLAFAALVIWHEVVVRRMRRELLLRDYYQAGLDRLEGVYPGAGSTGDTLVAADHVYARDLDIVGEQSLFHRLNGTHTSGGELALAKFLTEPCTSGEVRARQAAVAELRPRLDLREQFALHAPQVQADVRPRALVEWAEGKRPYLRPGVYGLVIGATVASAGLLLLSLYLSFWPALAGILAVDLAILALFKHTIQRVTSDLALPSRELRVLGQVLGLIEQEKFETGMLAQLQQAVGRDGVAASVAIKRLDSLNHLLELQGNQMFIPLGIVLFWPLHVAAATDRWRRRHGAAVGDWLEAVGVFEAVQSVATYAYEHPEDAVPEIGGTVATGEDFVLEAEGLAHPLLAPGEAIPNDVRLGSDQRLLIISGSNMSGKSTLMRTIGINVVLAQAGAPARATRFVWTPCALGATMRVHDSIHNGTSRFYAEILRLRQILDLAEGELPVLFLLDELLHGTNSHDRAIGAAAVLRGLLVRGAAGVITTHDLAITHLATGELSAARNMHFEDHFEGAELKFDYTLRDGVVRKSNALELMRRIGLKI